MIHSVHVGEFAQERAAIFSGVVSIFKSHATRPLLTFGAECDVTTHSGCSIRVYGMDQECASLLTELHKNRALAVVLRSSILYIWHRKKRAIPSCLSGLTC